MNNSLGSLLNIKHGEEEGLADFTKIFKNTRDIMDTKYGKFQMESYMQKEVTNWVTLEDEKHAAKV